MTKSELKSLKSGLQNRILQYYHKSARKCFRSVLKRTQASLKHLAKTLGKYGSVQVRKCLDQYPYLSITVYIKKEKLTQSDLDCYRRSNLGS